VRSVIVPVVWDVPNVPFVHLTLEFESPASFHRVGNFECQSIEQLGTPLRAGEVSPPAWRRENPLGQGLLPGPSLRPGLDFLRTITVPSLNVGPAVKGWGGGVNLQTASRTPTRHQVRERVLSLINEITAIPKEQITDHATVDGELQMQSVAFVELQVALEDEYQIQIDPIRVVELNEFGAIVDYVYECAVSQTP
jgi:acyl carrier protein